MKNIICFVLTITVLATMIFSVSINATVYEHIMRSNEIEFNGESLYYVCLLEIHSEQACAILHVSPLDDLIQPARLRISTQLMFDYADTGMIWFSDSHTYTIQLRYDGGFSQTNARYIPGAQYNYVIGQYYISNSDNYDGIFNEELGFVDGYFPNEANNENVFASEIVFLPGVDF